MNRTLTLALTVVVSLIGSRAAAQTLQVPNTFQAGTPARAAEVNQNFDAVAGAVNANSVDMAALVQRLETLESQVADLEARLADAEDNTVLKLNGYLDLDDHDPAKPVAILAGVNLQVINGLGNTNTINGLGNLIIGYDEEWNTSIWDEEMKICSLGSFENEADCEANGHAWSSEHKSGSHYLIVGERNRYSQYGGLVTGARNTVNSRYSTATGGAYNTASGQGSSVSGGSYNRASGGFSSVSGGLDNLASGDHSSISGGMTNQASGLQASVSGGKSREAQGKHDWVAGSLFQDF